MSCFREGRFSEPKQPDAAASKVVRLTTSAGPSSAEKKSSAAFRSSEGPLSLRLELSASVWQSASGMF